MKTQREHANMLGNVVKTTQGITIPVDDKVYIDVVCTVESCEHEETIQFKSIIPYGLPNCPVCNRNRKVESIYVDQYQES